MSITGAIAAAARKFDPSPGAILDLRFKGDSETGYRPFFKREGIIYPTLQQVRGFSSPGGAGFAKAEINDAWRDVAPDAPILGDDGLGVWEARTNGVRNPVMAGAVVGSPGTMPTNWGGTTLSAGLSREVVGAGVINGLPYIDIRVFGTLAGAGDALVLFESSTAVSVANGQTWTLSANLALVGGSIPTGGVFHRFELRDAGGVFLSSSSIGSGFTPTNVLEERRAETTISNASAAYARNGIYVFFSTGGPVDFTLRIAAPNLKLGADIKDPPILQTSGLAATRTAVAPQLSGLVLPPSFEVRSRFRLAALPAADEFRRVFSVNDGTQNNVADVYVGAGGRVRLYARSGAVVVAGIGDVFVEANTSVDVVASFKADAFALSVNGGPPVTDASGAAPVGLSHLQLGVNPELINKRYLNGSIERISLREAA